MKEKEKKEEKKNQKKKKPSSSFESDSSETDIDVSFESELEEDSEEPKRKQPKRAAKKIDSRKRKQILEDSSSESKSESTDEMQSRKRKHIIEDSSLEEEIHSYERTEIGTETIEGFLRQHQQGILEVSLATETDPLFQGQTEQSNVNKSSDSMFSRKEESLSDPAQQQIIVFRLSSQSLNM
ncbi:hypothetical protein AHAS_Ahas20G0134100 [Arachis hypogaea]